MSTKSHVDPDDSNGLSIGVEQTIKNTQSPDLRYHWSILSIILFITIFHVYNRMVRTNSSAKHSVIIWSVARDVREIDDLVQF